VTAVDLKAFLADCERLAERYPFFTDPDTRHVVTPVIGPGWLGILERLCADLAAELGPDRQGSLHFSDVKSKYGGMRVYQILGTDDERLEQAVEGVIGFYEEESERTCETCGAPGRQYNDGGWLVVACPAHARGTPT
jgi:hypothetical protein